jgi:hypothetical protein
MDYGALTTPSRDQRVRYQISRASQCLLVFREPIKGFGLLEKHAPLIVTFPHLCRFERVPTNSLIEGECLFVFLIDEGRRVNGGEEEEEDDDDGYDYEDDEADM